MNVQVNESRGPYEGEGVLGSGDSDFGPCGVVSGVSKAQPGLRLRQLRAAVIRCGAVCTRQIRRFTG